MCWTVIAVLNLGKQLVVVYIKTLSYSFIRMDLPPGIILGSLRKMLRLRRLAGL